MIKTLQHTIKSWTDKTFGPQRKAKKIAYHAVSEIDELAEELDKFEEYLRSPVQNEELTQKHLREITYAYADCFIVLVDSAAHIGVDFENIIIYMGKKMKHNHKNNRHGNI